MNSTNNNTADLTGDTDKFSLKLKSIQCRQLAITSIIKWFVKGLLAMPHNTRRNSIKRLGKLILRCAKKTRQRAISNIQNALPALSMAEVETLAYDAYANCAFGVAESLWLEQLEPDIFCDEATLKILQSGEGACIATMHLGCYEAVPLAVQKFSGKSVTLTNIPHFIEDGMQFYAKANIVAVNKNDTDAFATLLRHTCSNAYISLHSDLHANQIELDFFDRKVKAPAGIAMLSKMTKKPLLLAYAVYQDDGKIQVFFETIIDKYSKTNDHATTMTADISNQPVEQIMSHIYQRFEQIIKQYPDQWYWSYNRWRNKK
jgi:KDO2-lipid IV(A) lauroyltransferase